MEAEEFIKLGLEWAKLERQRGVKELLRAAEIERQIAKTPYSFDYEVRKQFRNMVREQK